MWRAGVAYSSFVCSALIEVKSGANHTWHAVESDRFHIAPLRRGIWLARPGNEVNRPSPTPLCGLFVNPETTARNLQDLTGMLPAGAADVARDTLTRIGAAGGGRAGLAAALAATALW